MAGYPDCVPNAGILDGDPIDVLAFRSFVFPHHLDVVLTSELSEEIVNVDFVM